MIKGRGKVISEEGEEVMKERGKRGLERKSSDKRKRKSDQ